jgi:hypothetical protein
MTAQIDPMQAAMAATALPNEKHYFGQVVTVDAWFCVLRKGAGKIPFDQHSHPPQDQRTAIKIAVECTKQDGTTYLVEQDTIDTAKDWLKHTLPSLTQLQLHLSSLKGRWVEVVRKPTGETYQSRIGETKDRTALVFVRAFADQAACQAAEAAFYAPRTGAGRVEDAILPADLPPAAAMDPEKEFALRSLPALWAAAKHNANAFKAMIDGNPMISKHYPWPHPHVQAIVAGTIDDQPPF